MLLVSAPASNNPKGVIDRYLLSTFLVLITFHKCWRTHQNDQFSVHVQCILG